MQQLCCCYLKIYGQTDRLTDMVKLRCVTLKLLENQLSTNGRWRQLFHFHGFPPSKPLSNIARWNTAADGETPSCWYIKFDTFYFVQETHNAMIITQRYLQLNTKHLSKFNRNKFLTYALLVFFGSNCHKSVWSSEIHKQVNFFVKLQYIPSQIATK